MIARPLILAALAALSATAVEAEDVALRSPRDDAYIRSIIGLDFKKHQQVMKELGIAIKDDVLSCICRAANYGSSSTSQFYHPDTIGEFNRRYSCNHPGPPCVVSGYGCTRHPFPTDSTLWDKCAARFPGSENIMQEMLRASRAIGGGKDDLADALKACRRSYQAERDLRLGAYDRAGYDYLKRKGIKLLPEPESVAKRFDDRARASLAVSSEKMRDQSKKAREELDKAILDTVGGKLFSDAKVKENASAVAQAASDLLALRLEETQMRIRALKKESDGHARGITFGEDHRLKNMREANSEIAQLERQASKLSSDKSQLDSFVKGLATAGDLLTLEQKINGAKSGGAREAADLVLHVGTMAQGYLNDFATGRNALGKSAGEALRRGVSPDLLQRFEKLQDRVAAVNTLNNALTGAVNLANKGMQAYSYYEKIDAARRKAEDLARSGDFNAAQTQMLNALRYGATAANIAADFMPPIVSDYARLCGDALKIPQATLAIINKSRDRADVLADLYGSQAGSDAVTYFQKAYPGAHLDREHYLFREAGLNGYRIDKGDRASGDGLPAYAVIPDADIAPYYFDERGYNTLREAAFLFPIATGKRMTDGDLADMFARSNGQVPDIADLRQKADTALRKAAEEKAMADMLGLKVIDDRTRGDLVSFRLLMSETLPKSCILSPDQQKRLFDSYRQAEGRDKVTEYLQNYGARLKEAEAAAQARQ